MHCAVLSQSITQCKELVFAVCSSGQHCMFMSCTSEPKLHQLHTACQLQHHRGHLQGCQLSSTSRPLMLLTSRAISATGLLG